MRNKIQRCLALSLLMLVAPLDAAVAQVAAEIELQSDYRVRGYSLSDERPAASLHLSYDDRSGIYAGGSLSGHWAEGEPRILAASGYLGYATRLNRSLSADVGVVRSHYGRSNSFGRSFEYTEFYAGISNANLATHVFFSPDYYGTGLATLYGQVQGSVELSPALRLNGHVGHLEYLEQHAYYSIPSRQDWRVSVDRRLGRTNLSVALSGRVQRWENRDTAIGLRVARAF